MKTALLVCIPSLLLAAPYAHRASAQSPVPIYPGRLKDSGAPIEGSPTDAAVASAGIEVSKTAFVDAQNVCGTIRITNVGPQPVTVVGITDSLEVHFPRRANLPVLPAGSTKNWYKVADVPIPLPGPIPPGDTATIDYCFSLCSAADAADANSMRNVVTVRVGTSARGSTVTTRSVSFPPPVLDCRACCLPDGWCSDTLPDDCTAAGGLPKGIGTDCATTECTQACCLGDGTCRNETLSGCEDDGGEPLGLGTTCTAGTACRGACCIEGTGCVDDVSVDECAEFADLGLGDPTYLGTDTTCASQLAACPSGACCFAGNTCFDVLAGVHVAPAVCDAEGGAYLGDGTTCANTTCPGACCVVDGCIDNLSRDECELNGTYLGDGSTCGTAGTACRGACCIEGTGCVDDVSVDECAEFADLGLGDPTYLGTDTTCASQLAVCPSGACCVAGNTCLDILSGVHISPAVCDAQGGAYLGDGTTCTGTNCEVQGGDPQGPGSDCGFGGLSPCSVIIDP